MIQRTMQQFGSRDFSYPMLAAIALGFMLGVAALWFSPSLVLGALIVILLLPAVLKRPELLIIGVLVATSSIVFEDRLPLLPIGIGRLQVPDVMLLGLFALVIVRGLVERDFTIAHTPLDLPLLLFFGLSLLSTGLAIWQSLLPMGMAYGEIRTIGYYLIFFAVTNLVRKEDQLTLLINGLVLLGMVVTVAMIAQFVVGSSVQLFPGRVEVLSTQGARYEDVTRVLPPGQSLALVGFVLTTVLLTLSRFKWENWLRFAEWLLLGLAVLLTFNRNFWVAVVIVVLLLFGIVRGQDRARLTGWILVVVFLGITFLFAFLVQPESQPSKLFQAASARFATLTDSQTFATLTDSQTLREDTLQFREIENEYALPQVLDHPLFGIGLGARYRPSDSRLDWAKYDGRAYIHNGHIWLILKTGFLGYASFIWLSIVFLSRALRSWRYISNRFFRGTQLAFALTFAGILVSALVSPIFIQWFWTPVIGIMLGMNEVILRLNHGQPT